MLHGDLVLVASGDPNLSQRVQPNGTLAFENEDHSYDGSYATRALPGDPLAVLRDLAAQISRAGIKQVEGRVLVDASLFPDGGSEGGTGVEISPIVVNDNLVDVTVTPGGAAGAPVTITVSPQTPYVTFVNAATTGAPRTEPTIDMSNDKTNANGSHTVTITGAMPMGKPILFAYRVPSRPASRRMRLPLPCAMPASRSMRPQMPPPSIAARLRRRTPPQISWRSTSRRRSPKTCTSR